MICADCRQQNEETVWSGFYRACLCPDCFAMRCQEDSEPITLDDLDEMCGTDTNFYISMGLAFAGTLIILGVCL